MTNNSRKQQLDEFFDHYRHVFNTAIKADDPDIERTAALFSSCFLAANPSGVNCGENNESFRDAMKKGYGFYKSIGMASMDIVSKEITLLDDFHAMAKIHWKANYLKRDGLKGSLEFENIYFIQTREERHQVFAYITGDEQAALKEAGLV